MNKVKEIDKVYKGPVITKEKENPNETEAKYQADGEANDNRNLCLLHQDKRPEKETEAKHQADDKTPTGKPAKNLGVELSKDRTAREFTKTLAKNLAKDPAKKKFTKNLAEKLAKDLNARKFTKTLAEKLAKDHTEAYIGTLTGRPAKNPTEEDTGGATPTLWSNPDRRRSSTSTTAQKC